jgi:hypothetical protein
VPSVASGTQNVDALFFMLGWDQYGFNKKRDGTRYAKLVFLHRYGFQKEREETRYTELAFLHPVGFAGHVVHCDAFGALKVNAFGAHAPVARVRIPQRV